MLPGSVIIKKCPECAGLMGEETLASGNTFGAVFWTDGKREAPMLPEQPWLVLCPHCDAPLWIDELEEVGRIDSFAGNGEGFAEAESCKFPDVDHFFKLLAGGVPGHEKERYLRLQAWWGGNDARRQDDAAIPLSEREVSNLTVLADMLDWSRDADLLMKAEIMRELGRFEEAASILARPFEEGLHDAVAIIKRLTEEKDPLVRQMHLE